MDKEDRSKDGDERLDWPEKIDIRWLIVVDSADSGVKRSLSIHFGWGTAGVVVTRTGGRTEGQVMLAQPF